MRLIVNADTVDLNPPAGSVLLDVLRRDLRLTGVKEGCREGDCGACLVLVGEEEGPGRVRWRAVNSCLFPAGDAAGRHVVTVEGLNIEGLTAVQESIVGEGATQCGFCTPGFVVALTGFLLGSPSLSGDDAELAAAGNICRCTGYDGLRRVCARLAGEFSDLAGRDSSRRIPELIRRRVLPAYFAGIPDRLRAIADARPAHPGADAENPVAVGGGTDLFVQRADALEHASLRFLLRRPEWADIRREADDLVIGGAATVESMVRSNLLADSVPDLQSAFPLISSRPIRERATLAGNLVNASPIGDLTILFLPLDPRLVLVDDAGVARELPLASFYLGYKKLDRRPGELVRALRFRRPAPGLRYHFEKVSRRTHLDIAAVNSAAAFEMDGGRIRRARISAGGVGPVPMRLTGAEAALAGRAPGPDALHAAQAAADAEISPIDDVRGSAAYKRALLRGLIAAHFAAGFPDVFPDPEP